jgi:methionyl-tRNA formyltransferase
MPKLGILNVHPSLLPKYRGASPIETAILNDDKNTGVTIMLMDEKMDHGPIVLQEELNFTHWPNKEEVRKDLAKVGGQMLVDCIPELLKGTLQTIPQNHDSATFTKLIKKEDGEIHDTDFELKKYLKYLAYTPWPGVFFFITKNDKKIRIKITQAVYENEQFVIKKVIPEGKSEMTFESFKNGYLI